MHTSSLDHEALESRKRSVRLLGGLFTRSAILAVVSVVGVGGVGGVAQPARAEVDRYLIDTGPLRIRDQFLPGLGYFGFDPVAADILEEGEWQVDFVLTVSNTFAHSLEVEAALETRESRETLGIAELRAIPSDRPGRALFYLDGEHARGAVAVRRGIGHGLQVELSLPVIAIGGGFLDSTIEGFHDAFSLGQAGRLGVPRDDFSAYLRTEEREVYLDRSPGTALGDAVVGLRYDLRHRSPTPAFQLAIEALGKLPTGDVEGLTSSGSADFGVQLLGTRYFRGSCLHFALGAAYLGPHDLLALDAQTIASGMLAWEIALGSKTTGLLQATVSQSPFGDLDSDEFSSASTQLTVGIKHALGSSVLFLGFTENLANFNNTADIGLHFGVTRAFGRH